MIEDKCTDKEAIVAFDFRLKKVVSRLLRFGEDFELTETQQNELGRITVDSLTLRYYMRKQAGILDE